MKPRHAAALALVGWYLMVPPTLDPRRQQSGLFVDLSAPLPKCDTVFDSVSPVYTLEQSPMSDEEIAIRAVIAKNAWILKIPHVTSMFYGLSNHEMIIVVGVDKEENVAEVEHKLPNKLDGFPVEVSPPSTGEYL